MRVQLASPLHACTHAHIRLPPLPPLLFLSIYLYSSPSLSLSLYTITPGSSTFSRSLRRNFSRASTLRNFDESDFTACERSDRRVSGNTIPGNITRYVKSRFNVIVVLFEINGNALHTYTRSRKIYISYAASLRDHDSPCFSARVWTKYCVSIRLSFVVLSALGRCLKRPTRRLFRVNSVFNTKNAIDR